MAVHEQQLNNFDTEGDLMDIIDIFDSHQQRIDGPESHQLGTIRRSAGAVDRLGDLEMRFERMRLVTNALWHLLKQHTSLTDVDLKRFIDKVDLADGKLDGKMARAAVATDCPHCKRRIRKSAVVCMWCGAKQT